MDTVHEPTCICADELLVPINERLSLIRKKHGLTFGTDAYLLYAYQRIIKNGQGTAVDLGSGTGVVALLCAARKRYRTIYAVEVQPSFAELIGRNAAINELPERIVPCCMDARTLTEQSFSGTVDAVFTNPPYLKQAAGKENVYTEKQIARHEEYGGIADFCGAASRLLRYGGYFYAVYLPGRMSDLLCAMRENELEPKRITMVYPTPDHAPCLLLVEGRKRGQAGLYATPPLILQTKNAAGMRMDTEDNQYIYEHGVFHERFFQP